MEKKKKTRLKEKGTLETGFCKVTEKRGGLQFRREEPKETRQLPRSLEMTVKPIGECHGPDIAVAWPREVPRRKP